ncbi:MAG: hypothetical protein A3D10_04280 [Omnitrophica WOR_2 bacterium RIFCSPHIGHO2_02_FULL_48_11]|nr:MAG: hypothetical protein A3D10_04280 [Omnitrophica WOR_2 bacterium RIFCSPHIGHO2_02_FULL_48_11]
MSHYRILIIDDDQNFTQVFKLTLEEMGPYEVCVENNADRAALTALQLRPDIIFLDVIMPEMEGPDVLCELRSNPVTRSIPIVILTATVTKDEVQSQEGMIGGHIFIAKPTTVAELVDCIEKNTATSQS